MTGDNPTTLSPTSSGEHSSVSEDSTASECNNIDVVANNLKSHKQQCDGTIGSECTLSCIQNFMTTGNRKEQTVRCTEDGWDPAIEKCYGMIFFTYGRMYNDL